MSVSYPEAGVCFCIARSDLCLDLGPGRLTHASET